MTLAQEYILFDYLVKKFVSLCPFDHNYEYFICKGQEAISTWFMEKRRN
jgi:hypothetical protein